VSYSAVAYVSTGVLVLVLCILVALRRSIATAIDVIKVGSDALRALPGLLVFPCTNVLCIGLFAVWWVFVAACLQSAGTLTAGDLAAEVDAGVAALAATAAAAGTPIPSNVTDILLNSMGDLNGTMT
jgi:hypothetical protein